LAGYAGADDPENAGDHGRAPRLRDRTPHRANQRRPARSELRNDLPALLRLEQEGYIRSEWGVSDNNRRAKYYSLTRAGRKQIEKETRQWEQTTEIVARFFAQGKESA
jgi:hypothetical protein